MEIKKIAIIVLIVISIPLAILCFSDNSQYKQLGDTHFYLLPNAVYEESFLYHDGGHDGGFFPIEHEGKVHDAYWNKQFIIIKCSQGNEEHRYIIRNLNYYKYSDFNVRHYSNETDYQNALDSLNISESTMEHTDGNIPWRIHL